MPSTGKRDPAAIVAVMSSCLIWSRNFWRANAISDGTYARAASELGETTLVIATVGFYNMVCTTLVSFDIEAPGNAGQKLLE